MMLLFCGCKSFLGRPGKAVYRYKSPIAISFPFLEGWQGIGICHIFACLSAMQMILVQATCITMHELTVLDGTLSS